MVFGILILLVALAMVACWYMSWPKTAALLVALLWLSIALIMLLGTGERAGKGAATALVSLPICAI